MGWVKLGRLKKCGGLYILDKTRVLLPLVKVLPVLVLFNKL